MKKTTYGAPSSWRTALWAAVGVFCLLLLRPALIAALRVRATTTKSAAWAASPSNGRFRLLVPELFPTRSHDEAYYGARVNQILRHGYPRDPYWRDDVLLAGWLHDSLGFYILSAFAFLAGRDLTWGWALAVAALGAAWFLWFFAVFRWWSGRDEATLPLALVSVVFPDLYVWLLDVNLSPRVNLERWSLVFVHRQAEIGPIFRRLPSQMLSYFLLALLLWGAWDLACRSQRSMLRAALLGLGFGAMALVHPYEFTFGLAALSLFAMALWASRVPGSLRAAAALGAALLLSAAYLALQLATVDPQARRESLDLIGWTAARRFYWVTLVHPVAAALMLGARARERDAGRAAAWLLLACLQGAAFACRNAQLVTGGTVQVFHYISFGSFGAALALMLWISERPWWTRRAAIGVGAAALLLALSNESRAALSTYRLFGLPRDVEAAADWVDANLPEDALVASLSMEANLVLPLYTGAKVLGAPSSPNLVRFFTRDEYLGRIASLLKTCGADPDLFLKERWVTPERRLALAARMRRRQLEEGELDYPSFEPAEWFYSWMPQDPTDGPSAAGRRRLRELYETAPPAPRPYHLWVAEADRALLRRPPESLGGRRVFSNGSVEVFEFR